MRRATLHLSAGILIAVSLWSPVPGNSGPATTTESDRSEETVVYGGTEADRSAVRLGLATYSGAGLILPSLRIYVHAGREPCGGWGGVYDADGSGRRIDLCRPVLLHELAHAWMDHNLDEDRRSAYLDRINLSVWHHRDTPHAARGVEHAANLISWGVQAEPLDPARVDLYTERLELYELLTGRTSPRLTASSTHQQQAGEGA